MNERKRSPRMRTYALPSDQRERFTLHAKHMRKELTPAERLLWRELRGRRFAGYKFRRQHVFEPYVADFYCHQACLVVEVDGETHLRNQAHDRKRTDALEARGLTVLRVWNSEVYENLDGVLELIFNHCQKYDPER